MHAALRPVRRTDLPNVRAFLRENPYENVLLDWLLSHRAASGEPEQFLWTPGAGETVAGCVHFGRQTVLAAADEAALARIAQGAPRNLRASTIVASQSAAHAYWEAVKSWHPPPRLVRRNQPVFSLRAEHAPVPQAQVVTRLARSDEAEVVARHSAAMIEHELGYNPMRVDGAFGTNVRRMIERGMWWVGLVHGTPAFFCHVGPHSRETAQLQGVWTVPQRRRAGIASAALANICGELLTKFPSISLYVNDFNSAAISLYQRLGFRQSGSLATYLF